MLAQGTPNTERPVSKFATEEMKKEVERLKQEELQKNRNLTRNLN